MDPDETLSEIRELAQLIAGLPGIDPAADRLAALCQYLDGWMSGGGFPPAPWADKVYR